MNGTITPKKNNLIAWDITTSVKAGAKESIARVELTINGFNVYDEDFSPTVNQWEKILTQQGQFPGDNKAELTVTDANGDTTHYVEEWS